MNRALWKLAVAEARLLWASAAAALFAFCWLRVWLTSQLDMARFKNILDQLPADWERLSPVPFDQLVSYPGRIAVTYEEPITYLVMVVWCIARGSDCVSGPLGRGTLEMVLAQPLSRLQVLWTHTAVTLAGVVLLALVAHAGICAGVATTSVMVEPPPVQWTIPILQIPISLPTPAQPPERVPMSELVPTRQFLPAVLNYACLGLFLTGFTSCLSAGDRYRWRTIGIAVGFYVVQSILEVVGLASESWSWLRRLTFLTAYEPIAFVSTALRHPDTAWAVLRYDAEGRWIDLGPLGYDAILVGLGLLGLLLASVIFHRRDLPAPL